MNPHTASVRRMRVLGEFGGEVDPLLENRRERYEDENEP
jgi:hypothetical protein